MSLDDLVSFGKRLLFLQLEETVEKEINFEICAKSELITQSLSLPTLPVS